MIERIGPLNLLFGRGRLLVGWRAALALLAVGTALVVWLPTSASATSTNYCDGSWNSNSTWCWSAGSYPPPNDNWMSYNQGINYTAYGDMVVWLSNPNFNGYAYATSSEYEAYLCYSNQEYDSAAIRPTGYYPSRIAGHDDNYSRSGCWPQG